MLRYKVKSNINSKLKGFPIRELYVSPDLNYISGVTDYNVGLVNGEEIVIKSPYLIGSELNTINTLNVKRQGKLGVKVVLPVKTIEKPLKFDINHNYENGETYITVNNNKVTVEDSDDGYVFSTVTQNYVEYNGDVSYFFSGSSKGYLINHKFYEASFNDTEVEIETYLYIEDGKLVIGDNTYYADFSIEEKKPILRLNKIGEPISQGTFLGECDGKKYYALSDSDNSLLIKEYKRNDWKNVTHFSIVKHENPIINAEDVMFGGYNHYISYSGNNYYLGEVYNDDGEYEGYGVKINDVFNPCNCGYLNDELFEAHRDLYCGGCSVSILNTGEIEEVKDSLYSSHNGGKFVLLIDVEEDNDIIIGNFIEVNSYYPLTFRRLVEDGDGDVKYIMHNGDKYFVKNHLYDTIKMSDVEYKLNYINNVSAYCEANGEKIYFDIADNKATISHKIYYKDKSSSNPIRIKYGKEDKKYQITNNSGVTFNGVDYPVIKETETYEDEGEVVSYYVDIKDNVKYYLEITDINGSSTYICYPVCNDDELNEIEKDELQREISSVIVNNWKSIEFKLRKDTFGQNELTVENGLMKSMISEKPYTASNNYLLEEKIEILRIQNYLSFKFPIMSKVENNLRREGIIKNDFVDYVRDNSINSIVDMEKDVYYPVWTEIRNDRTIYNPIKKLVFNLHFRTRTLDNWRVIEDDREFENIQTPNSLMSHWFVTDYKYYRSFESNDVLQNSSDLLGFLNFSTSEVKNMASKLSRSFLRLSFYSTNDPNTQVLLYTSTIFFDENYAFSKYMSLKRNSDLKYMDVVKLQESKFNDVDEYINNGSDEYQISSNTTSNFSEVIGDYYLNDGLRLSSRFSVTDKYSTSTSSDGYYLYLFKEYANKMREATIYLKVEFNHAGVGKSIPFMMPRAGEENIIRIGDLNFPSDGFPMNDIYNQLYIPIKLIYDDNENKYVYYLPDGLREQNYLNENSIIKLDDETMVFNLFEVKFKNESVVKNENS